MASYKGQDKILIAIDCIIFGFDSKELKLLLFKRKVNPFKGYWSLIGAFIKKGLNLEDTAKQVLVESTGFDNIYLEELKSYSNLNRDPSERVISVAYFGLIRIDEFNSKNIEGHNAQWFSFNAIPNLVFDHQNMVDDAVAKLRLKVKYEAIGFELLPKEFTMPQLQKLYEAIYQKDLDPRNFRKKVLSLSILTNTEKKDKSNSKKGAYLYTFNKAKFDKFAQKRHYFEMINRRNSDKRNGI